MLISTLLAPWVQIPTQHDAEITTLTLDSRTVAPGSAFVALQGQKADGSKYKQDAIARGARLVLQAATASNEAVFIDQGVLHVSLRDLTSHLPALAERFHEVISQGITLLGVTGTNGKTSCTHFLADIYQQAGVSCGIIGTLGAGFYGQLQAGTHTTPDILTLYSDINRLQKQGANKIALEVSSHSIDQKRIAGLPFETGIFTNLTQDHLDYHGTMEQYAAVKYQFLQSALTKNRVINVQDPYGRVWAKKLLVDHHPVMVFGMEEDVRQFAKESAVYASEIRLLPHGIQAMVHSPKGAGLLSIPLLGEFNLSNALAVIATLLLEGWDLHELLPYFNKLSSVPGRMQVMGGGDKPVVVIDYAHTPDALEKALLSLKRHAANRIICVFGCGGDRDRSKRAQMGRIASQLADHVILTNDNPRSEEPLAIIHEIAAGIEESEALTVVPDRSKAIQNSIQYARSGDVVLIAGKGAERFQYIGDQAIPFQDEEEVRHRLMQFV